MKYEFHDGLIIAMAGGTPKHAQISANTIWVLTLGILGFVFASKGEKTIAKSCWSSALVVCTLFLSVMLFRMLG